MSATATIPFRDLSRKEKVAVMRKHHEPVFEALNASNALFACKSLTAGNFKDYILPKGKIGFFESELKTDCYFEMTAFDITATDQNRQLYVLKQDPGFATNITKYQLVEKTPTGTPQYYVDLKDCLKANIPIVPLQPFTPVEEDPLLMDDRAVKEDMGLEKLTARDRVCIDLRVPDSNHEWINDLIRKAL